MLLQQLRITGYRSIRDLWLSLDRVNVVVGPNGCGKTNVYRSLELLHRGAAGQLAMALADEGGMPSALWAGERRKGPVRMAFEARLEELEYSLACGLPQPPAGAFLLDPEIKEEQVWYRDGRKRLCLMDRKRTVVTARNAEGERVTLTDAIPLSESVLTELRRPDQFPVLFALRQEFLSWRFYHQFRTDAASPIREPQVGVRTPVLSPDGRDLAAALQTIREIGDFRVLDEAIARAFPGAGLYLQLPPDHKRFSLALQMPGFRRPFEARELSDGTLHYLCLVAALLSPRPPSLLAINEPETSIHPDLIPALSELIARASEFSQILITTHSRQFCDEIQKRLSAKVVELQKVDGETRVVPEQ